MPQAMDLKRLISICGRTMSNLWAMVVEHLGSLWRHVLIWA